MKIDVATIAVALLGSFAKGDGSALLKNETSFPDPDYNADEEVRRMSLFPRVQSVALRNAQLTFSLVLYPTPQVTRGLTSCTMTYWNPTYYGLKVDWCKDFEKDCGRPAADLFCKKKGFSASSSYSKDISVSKTLTVGNHAVCEKAYHQCDSFNSISCKRTSCRFNYPQYRSQPLDWCKRFARECGRPAADEFCKKNGYSFAKYYFKARYTGTGETLTIGDHAECDPDHHRCDTFAYITCA